MGLFRKSRPPEEEEERDLGAVEWLQPNGLIKLLIFCFILYVFVGPYFSSDSRQRVLPGDNSDKQAQGEEVAVLKPFEMTELDEVSIFGYRVVDKIRAQGVMPKDVKTGSGSPVACGQEVDIAYRILGENGQVLFPEKGEHEQTLRLGAADAASFLAEGLPGMKAGGLRKVFFSPEKIRDKEGKSPLPEDVLRKGGRRLTAEIHLQSVRDPLPDAGMDLKVFSRAKGTGDPLPCGGKAHIRYKAWGGKGEKLGEGALDVQPGKNTLPLGLELGVVGLRPGGARTLVVPPEFVQPRHESGEGEKLRSILAPGTLLVLDISRDSESPKPAPKP
ncbi:MAG: hypothetical protein J0L97_02770 [Alphaproteobacteria bacterium]|nr:hypothetical protein [Alphaproteobacteria bacterium]